jgi:hypothetical protein
MYLTNDERIRLGLQHYGSDVPEEVVAEAEAALASPCGGACPAPTKAAAKTRSRNKKGEFEGDDPTTTEVNEAFVEG